MMIFKINTFILKKSVAMNIQSTVNFYHTAAYEIIPDLLFTRQFHLAHYEKRTAYRQAI